VITWKHQIRGRPTLKLEKQKVVNVLSKAIDDSRLSPRVRNLAVPPDESKWISRYVAHCKPVSIFPHYVKHHVIHKTGRGGPSHKRAFETLWSLNLWLWDMRSDRHTDIQTRNTSHPSQRRSNNELLGKLGENSKLSLIDCRYDYLRQSKCVQRTLKLLLVAETFTDNWQTATL